MLDTAVSGWGLQTGVIADVVVNQANGIPQQVVAAYPEPGALEFVLSPTTGPTSGGVPLRSGGNALDTMLSQSWGSAAAQNAAALGASPTALAATCMLESGCQNIDGSGSRRNARNSKRIDIERAVLQELHARRTANYEEVIVTVTSSDGSTLRKVFYSVPSRLMGHRLRVRLKLLDGSNQSLKDER